MKVSRPPKLEDIFLKEILRRLQHTTESIVPNLTQLKEAQSIEKKQTLELTITPPTQQQSDEFQDLLESGIHLLANHKTTDRKGRYLYWDKIKHKYGKQADMVWLATKVNRLIGKKALPFHPQHPFTFCVPDTMQALLHFIDKKCGSHIMLNQYEKPLSEVDKKILTIEEAITSAQLEGAVTTRRVAKQLLASKRPQPKNKHETMIVNNHRLMQKAMELKNQALSIDLILDLHRIATENAIENEAISGEFRQNNDIHIADYDGNPVYQPPHFEQVPELMANLCQFANEEHDGIQHSLFIHPVIKAIMLHFLMGYIHPFGDGNGRTARALFYWFMLKNGYQLFEYISISRLLNQAPAKYAKSYLYTELDDLDMTYFIYYQLDIIKRAIDDLEHYIHRESEKLQNFTAEIIQFSLKNQLSFNQRQIEILQMAVQDAGKQFTVKQLSAQMSVAENTVRKDLNELCKQGFLLQMKAGNAMVFIAPMDLKARLQSSGD